MATTFLEVKNRAVSTLASGIDNAVTSLTVASGEGALFPSSYPFHITIDDEIMSCTNRSTDVLTVTREVQGTTAASHSSGAVVALNITAQNISDLNTAVNTLEAAGAADHGGLSGLSDDDHPQYQWGLSSPLDLSTPSGFAGGDSSYEPYAVAFNGRYWLIGGIVDISTYLVKWDGVTFTNLTSNLIGFSGLGVTAIVWCGTFWLIGGANGYVNKWDESTWTDLTSAFGWTGVEHVQDMAWNGSFAVVAAKANNDRPAKYDGTTVTDITPSPDWGDYPQAVESNGDYFLLGSFEGEIQKYDSDGVWTDLTAEMQAFNPFPYRAENYGEIRTIAWNGEYFLIGSAIGTGGGASDPVLVKYDGVTFTDMSSALVGLENYVNNIVWTGVTWVVMDNQGNVNLFNGYKCEKLAGFTMTLGKALGAGNDLCLIGGYPGKLYAFTAWGDPASNPHRVTKTFFIPFTGGTEFFTTAGNPWGYRINTGGEFAIAIGTLPYDLQSVLNITVYGVGWADAGAGNSMHIELTADAAGLTEDYNGLAIDVVNKDSKETNLLQTTVLHWVFTSSDDAQIGQLRAGDRLQLKVLHEAAGGGDIATEVSLGGVTIQYI